MVWLEMWALEIYHGDVGELARCQHASVDSQVGRAVTRGELERRFCPGSCGVEVVKPLEQDRQLHLLEDVCAMTDGATIGAEGDHTAGLAKILQPDNAVRHVAVRRGTMGHTCPRSTDRCY